MPKEPPVQITVCCMMKLESSNLSYEPTELITYLRERLEKRLLKKGFAIQWVPQTQNPALLVHMVRLDEGNQALRYLLPFISPAVLEVQGRVTAPNTTPRQFIYAQKAHFGLFGGTPRNMMKLNADRVSAKVAKEVVNAFRS